MYKTIISFAKKIAPVVLVAGLVGLSACSDGEVLSQEAPKFDITPVAPLVIAFSANPAQIKAGGSTTLSWEAANADSIEITAKTTDGEEVKFNVKSEDLKGSAPVEGLMKSTDFTLTAIKKVAVAAESVGEDKGKSKDKKKSFVLSSADEAAPAADEVAGPTSKSQKITVTVIPATGLDVQVTAEPAQVNAGEQSLIKWTVNPADGVTVTVKSNTEESVVAFSECEGDIATIIAGTPADPAPAVGCAVVTPAEDTVYTVEASTADGVTSIGEIEVKVGSDAAKNAEIFVGDPKVKQLSVASFDEAVKVSWSVKPATGTITITANPAAECEPKLENVRAEGSSLCKLSGATEFAINANGKEDKAGVSLASSGVSGSIALSFSSQWAFVGEEVPLTIALTEDSKTAASGIQKVFVNNEELSPELVKQLKENMNVVVPKKARVGVMGIPVKVIYGGGEATSNAVQTVVQMNVKPPDTGIAAVTGATFDSKLEHRYAGVKKSGYAIVNPKHRGANGKEIPDEYDLSFNIYRDGSLFTSVNFGKPIKDYYDMADYFPDPFFTKIVVDFPVKVAVRKTAERTELYAGTSGALFRSKDGGVKWETLMINRERAYIDYQEKGHPTCGMDAGAKKQKWLGGLLPTYTTGAEFVSLNQVCDIISKENGVVIVATDVGVRVDKNIDDNVLEFDTLAVPAVGADIEKTGLLTYGHVVNDLEEAGSRVFAGADNGVFVSEDDGIHWKKFGSITESVYALSYDAIGKKIYAGTTHGLKVSPADGEGSFTDIGSQTKLITAIAVDKAIIVVGTDVGAEISRDGGATWSSIGQVTGQVEALALESFVEAGKVSYGIAFGTAAGEEISSKFQIATSTHHTNM